MSIEHIPKSSLSYTRSYCEENVWKLCETIRDCCYDLLDDCYVVFISNDSRVIPLWYQKASPQPNTFIVWDYHVILIHKKNGGESVVYDFDTTLDFPCDFKVYVSLCIRDETNITHIYHRYFRVIKAEEYLSNFASDRSHMKNEDGSWKMPPPDYSAITCQHSTNNIECFISMDPRGPYGVVMPLHKFVALFSPNSS